MITYFYWAVFLAAAGGVLYVVGGRFDRWRAAFAGSIAGGRHLRPPPPSY